MASKMVTKLDADEPMEKPCEICQIKVNDPVILGDVYITKRFQVHYFCLVNKISYQKAEN